MSRFIKGWYLIYTRPSHEKKIYEDLQKERITCFLPLNKQSKVWCDRVKITTTPLFPSYVFIFLDKWRDYFKVTGKKGFTSFVKCGKQLVLVDNDLIENLKILVESQALLCVSANRLVPGQKMTIHGGALSGLACEVIQENYKKKIVVKVEIFNNYIITDLPIDSLIE